MKVDQTFLSFDGTKIAFRIWGEPTDRTPVVFFSGIACDDVYWTSLAPSLAADRLVITWDYPYHGDSGPAGDPSEITIESLTRHALGVLDQSGVQRAVLVGHSMGVQVIFQTYDAAPDRVCGLITMAGPYAHTVGHLYGTNAGHWILRLLEQAAKIQPGLVGAFWKASTNPRVADPLGRAAGLIGQAPVSYMQRYFEHLGKFEPERLIAMFRAGHDHSAEEILPRINVPVLILHGSHDVMTPFPLAQEMKARIEDCELVQVEGGAHTLPVEDPELIETEVRRFLARRVDS